MRDEEPPAYDAGHEPAPRLRTEPFGMIPWDVYDRLEGDASAQAVYLALLRHANADGECWPSVATICRKTGKSDRHIRDAIDRLVTLGIITKQPRDVGGMKSVNSYRICQKTAEDQIGTEYRTSGNGYRADRYVVPDRAVLSADRTRTSELKPNELDTPRPPKGEKPKRTPSNKTTFPEDFEITPAMYDWAASTHGLSAEQVRAKTTRFENWARANGTKYADWERGWRNFMEPKEWDREGKPGNGKPALPPIVRGTEMPADGGLAEFRAMQARGWAKAAPEG